MTNQATEGEREELCSVISEAVGGWNAATRTITHVADVLMAAGYRKPSAGMEYAVFRRGDGHYGSPVENLRYRTREGARESIKNNYAHPEYWEVRGREVGEWSK